MRLTGLSNAAISRIKRAQWDVDESGQAVPMGSTPAQPAGQTNIDDRVTVLEDQFQQQNSVLQEWLDYLNNYNSGMSQTLNELWNDVNTIGQDVDLLREQVSPTQFQQQKTPTTYSDLYQGVMNKK